MYKSIIRPFLFLFYAEDVHHFVRFCLNFFFSIPGSHWIAKRLFTINDKRLEREVFGLKFANPVGIAAGFDKDATMFNELSYLGFGHIEIGTVTPKGQAGNPKPRLFRLPKDKALINRMGFNNGGVLATCENLKKRKTKAIIGANLGKNTVTPNENAVDDYVAVFEGLYNEAAYFVVNVSCPNISDLHELQDQKYLEAILNAVMEKNTAKPKLKPILLKVSPDLNDGQLDEVITVIEKTGIHGVIAANTSVSREGLTTDEEKVKSIANGGLSGKPLNKRSTEVISYLHENSKGAFPIIAVGGIINAEDAIEKLEAGASLVQVYTGFIYEGPFLAKRINKAILKTVNVI
ncbi:MAG: quinone-dependent dihydroorotate dehydrogenase [Bacteroidales bacterium]|jgi:dihydroorotate dehydrogenase|nr:quinone-dependent dihydroorotate dehydrogenase [Bacteroidales bacterium]